MAATAIKDTSNQGFVLSLILHGGIIAAAVVGMPFLKSRMPTETPPLIVDLVPIEEIASAPPPPSKEEAPVAPVAPPEPPAPVQAQAPPSDALPPPPKEEVPQKEPEKVVQPKVRPTSKPTPPPDKKKDVAMLQDLLKDMQKKAPAPTPQAKSASATPSNNIAPNITDRASMTELDAIRRHIEGCWRIDPGTEGMEGMSAEVQVIINPDGSVRDAKIIDMARYFADAAFRRFATSARTAILGCGNIPISQERYNILKDITFNFSPQGRLN
ncbi:MAG: TonB C-terminal domain-containing protein [Rhodospirillaceae bacterium]|nr:TonB C-terminal domain-containing protein [Rhodospirillaceae bacterium]